MLPRPVILTLAICSLMLSGCGPKERQPNATMSGKVTLGGRAAPAGSTIQFVDPTTGNTAVGMVEADGSYKAVVAGVQGVFSGTYQVSVTGPNPVIDAEKAMEPDFVPPEDPIPARYQSAASSGETVTVTEGENTYDLNMKR